MFIIIFVLMFTACSKVEENEILSRQETYSGDETSSSGSNEITDNETLSEATEQNSAVETDEVADTVDNISLGINLVSSKNMPIASEALVYKGQDMQYGAVLHNGSNYDVNYTFMILNNGSIQPFSLEGEDKEVNCITFSMKRGEEKIIHYCFKPVAAPYENQAVLSFVGIAVKKNPSTSIDDIMMNAAITDYNIFLTAEKKQYEIKQNNTDHIVGEEIEQLQSDGDDTVISVALSDEKLSQTSINKIETEVMDIDRVKLYIAKKNNEKYRLFLLNEGELLKVFDKRLYGDIESNNNALYEINLDQDGFHKDITNKSCVIIVDMKNIEQVISGETNIESSISQLSQLYLLEN